MLTFIKYLYRVKKQTRLNLQLVKQIRQQLQQQLPGTYSVSQRQHIDRVYQQRLYGRKCYIAGITSDTYLSTTYIKSIFSTLNPTHVILGGYNNSRVLSNRIARTFQQKKLVHKYDNNVQLSKMYCKTLLTPMVYKILEQDPNYNKNQQDDHIVRYDHKNKHIWHDNYMTIINRALFKQFSKLSFGLPSDYIIFQDLLINQSLQQLQQIYNKIIDFTLANRNKYGKQQKSTLFYPQIILQQIRYNALNQPILVNKQLTYTTALLHKYCSIGQKVVLFVQNQFVHQISQNVHKITINPKDVYRGGHANIEDWIKNNGNSQAGVKINKYLFPENKDIAIQQILRKFAILSILKNDQLQRQLLQEKHNIFKKTVFASLFADLTVAQIIQRYLNVKKKYKLKFGQIIQQRVINVLDFQSPQKDFYTLTQMLYTQQQRIQDFPAQFRILTKQSIQQQRRDLLEIQQYIKIMVKNQLPPSQKELMQFLYKGNLSKQNIILYNKLFVEAKIRLKKTNIKLPLHHYSKLSAIFKDQLKNNMLKKNTPKIQDNSQRIFKKKISQLQQKGFIRQVTSEQEIQMFTNDSIPRISVDIDKNGQTNFHSDCRTPEQMEKLVQNWKKDEMFRDLVTMTEKAEKMESDEQQFYEQQEEKPTKMNKKTETKGRRSILKEGDKINKRSRN